MSKTPSPNTHGAASWVARCVALAALTWASLAGPQPALAASQTYSDSFDSQAYDGGSGDWGGDWVEVGESNGTGSGSVQVVTDTGVAPNEQYAARINNDNRGLRRLLGTSLGTYSSATLSFEYRRANALGRTLQVQVSTDGSNWTTLLTLAAGDDAAYQSASVDLSLGIANSTTLRFYIPSDNGSGAFYIDDVSILADTAAPIDTCYLAADSGGANGGNDLFVKVDASTGAMVRIGTGLGTNSTEAIAHDDLNRIVYATTQISSSEGRLGTIDPSTGVFTAKPNPIGSGDGALGTIAFADVDGLTIDPFTGALYASVRRESSSTQEDLLIQLDTATGQYVADAFGANVDYVVVNAGAVTGFYDIDDLAADAETGWLYAIANNGGSGDRLVRVDKTTGAVTDIGALGINDMEGLAFDNLGHLFGTTGSAGGGNSNSLFDVDKATGVASNRRALASGSDYEAVDCLTQGVNTITGTVYHDQDGDAALDGGEPGTSGVTVYLYRDANGDGQWDAGDVLLTSQDTDGTGNYSFTFAATGKFVVRIDTADLPAGHTLTTDNLETADFGTAFGLTDAQNDFGHAQMDYGDLPAAYANTLLADDGPRHVVGDLYLGTHIGAEADGQENASAAGDTYDDGVAPDLSDAWAPGATVDLQVYVTGSGGYLVGWFDWNDDGVLDEMVDFGSLSAGLSVVQLTLPDSFVEKTPVFGRFRLFDGPPGSPSPTGLAANGEVEDYYFVLTPTAVKIASFQAHGQAARPGWALPLAALALAGLGSAVSTRRRARRRPER